MLAVSCSYRYCVWAAFGCRRCRVIFRIHFMLRGLIVASHGVNERCVCRGRSRGGRAKRSAIFRFLFSHDPFCDAIIWKFETFLLNNAPNKICRILSVILFVYLFVDSVGFGVHGSCGLCCCWRRFVGWSMRNKYTWVGPKLDYDFLYNFLSFDFPNQHSFAWCSWACQRHLLGGPFCESTLSTIRNIFHTHTHTHRGVARITACSPCLRRHLPNTIHDVNINDL